MSKLYGSLQGCRGEATRCGTANSGIRSSVQSWHGSCITELNYNSDNQLMLSIDTSDDSRSIWGNRKYYGSIEKFNDLMDTINSIGTEKSIEVLKSYLQK